MKSLLLSCCLFFVLVAASQNVGIGTTTPPGRLHIKGETDTSQLVIDVTQLQGLVAHTLR